MGDYKIKEESEEGKIIISGAYEIQEKKLLISFGKIIKHFVTANDRSMYHETNILN